MSKSAKIRAFDPNGPGASDAGIYGLPFTCEEADIVLVPVPWEVTTSFGGGTSMGPAAIREASLQVDLLHPEFPDLWKRGIAMDGIPDALLEQSRDLKGKAEGIITDLANGVPQTARRRKALELINAECAVMNEWVEQRCGYWMDQGKLVGLVGGDHSTPLGLFRAQAARHRQFGILHIDAHMDLRIAYEGFTYSHASILFNALPIKQLARVVQVGIRDHCQEEADVVRSQKGRVKVHTNAELHAGRFEGTTWRKQCDRIIAQLPKNVHVSFDIDGLDPALCPHTGTPVPGGLRYEEATYLLSRLAASGRVVIGFDLVEVSLPHDADPAGSWDANVGARLLWHLCGVLAATH